MPRLRFSRMILACLAASAVLLLASAGCNSSVPGGRLAGGSGGADEEPAPLVLESESPEEEDVAAPWERWSRGEKQSGSANSSRTASSTGTASRQPAYVAQRQPAATKTAAAIATKPTAKAPVIVKPAKGGKNSDEKFDPIKEHGLFFKDWDKPRLALVITGREDGYFEPCGCAGLEKMKGGLSRRMTMLNELRQERGWPVVAVDVGGLIKGYGKQAELKYQITVEAMNKMRYDAIGMGKNDLKLPTTEVLAVVAPVKEKKSPFLAANVNLFGAPDLPESKRIVTAGGIKVGITSVLGKKFHAEIHSTDSVSMSDPEGAIRKVLPELQKEKCNLLVLLAHATIEESKELARKFPQFDVVVTAGGAPEPPHDKPEVIGQKTMLVEVGEKGMNAIVLGFFDDPKQPVRYQRVILDSRYKSAPEIVALMEAYQDQLKRLSFVEEARQVSNPRAELNGAYVGSQKCESCHEESYKVWKKSGHSKAYDTLATKAAPARNFDPECVSCHVIGWHPTEYFPYKGGFRSVEKTPHLVNVGCESCHGPGAAHCAAEEPGSKKTEQQKLALQKALVVTKAEAEKNLCVSCHDLDNSPDFDFESYWPKVEHKEKTE